MMKSNEKVQHWVGLAEYDLEVAKTMKKNKHYLYVGFMCHQTIEKAFKAAVTKVTQDTPPKIHNLVKLCEKRVCAECYLKNRWIC